MIFKTQGDWKSCTSLNVSKPVDLNQLSDWISIGHLGFSLLFKACFLSISPNSPQSSKVIQAAWKEFEGLRLKTGLNVDSSWRIEGTWTISVGVDFGGGCLGI